MMIGPTQLTPMYCAPRGSWCAHISSRTTVCSHTEASRRRTAPARPCTAVAIGQRAAESLRHFQIGRVVGEGTQIVLGHFGSHQIPQLGTQGVGLRSHVEFHRYTAPLSWPGDTEFAEDVLGIGAQLRCGPAHPARCA
jgi:hypothetical protein